MINKGQLIGCSRGNFITVYMELSGEETTPPPAHAETYPTRATVAKVIAIVQQFRST